MKRPLIATLIGLALAGCQDASSPTGPTRPTPTPAPTPTAAPAPTVVPTPSTPPRVVDLRWAGSVVAVDGCPLPGEAVDVWCTAVADGGHAMTVELRFTNLGPGTIHPIQEVLRAFPASSEPHEIFAWYGLVSPTDVRATCTATDALGMTASRTMDILCGCGGGWCPPRE